MGKTKSQNHTSKSTILRYSKARATYVLMKTQYKKSSQRLLTETKLICLITPSKLSQHRKSHTWGTWTKSSSHFSTKTSQNLKMKWLLTTVLTNSSLLSSFSKLSRRGINLSRGTLLSFAFRGILISIGSPKTSGGPLGGWLRRECYQNLGHALHARNWWGLLIHTPNRRMELCLNARG